MIDTKAPDERRQRYRAPTEPSYPASTSTGGIELLSLTLVIAALVRHRRPLAVWPTLLATLVVGVSLLFPRTYTASSSFAPVQVDASTLSSLAGLASQFGVAMPQANAAQSPAFYADLLKSRPILEALVDSQYRVRVDSGMAKGDLVTFFDIHGSPLPMRRELTILAMRDHLLADFDPRTGVVEFSARTKWRDLSYEIARNALALVNDFNLRSRQQQAEAQRAFAESRLSATRGELAAAEDALGKFMQRNRSFANDPVLSVEHDRLSRDVQIKQQIYLSLAQSFEQSRLDAVRNTPTINIVAEPSIPIIPDRRYLFLKGVAAFVFGFLVIAGFILTRQAVQSHSTGQNELAVLRDALRDAKADAASILRVVTRSPSVTRRS